MATRVYKQCQSTTTTGPSLGSSIALQEVVRLVDFPHQCANPFPVRGVRSLLPRPSSHLLGQERSIRPSIQDSRYKYRCDESTNNVIGQRVIPLSVRQLRGRFDPSVLFLQTMQKTANGSSFSFSIVDSRLGGPPLLTPPCYTFRDFG